MARHHLLAFTNRSPDGRRVQRWYDERHVPTCSPCRLRLGQRFALTDATGQGKPG